MTPETFLRWLFAIERPPAIGDWEELERWLEVLHAAPLAYGTIRRRGEESLVPEAVLGRLKQRYLHQTALSLELLGATRELTAKLSAEGVPSRLLKGGALFAAGVYDDPGIRYTQDIDVLIDPRDAKKAGAVLESLGYVTSGIGGAPKHLPPYYRGRVAVELHEWAYWDAHGKKVGLAELSGVDGLAPTVSHLMHHLVLTSSFEPWLLVRTLSDLRAVLTTGESRGAGFHEHLKSVGLEHVLTDLSALLGSLLRNEPLEVRASELLRRAGRFEATDSSRAQLLHYASVLRRAPWWYVRGTIEAVLLPSRETLAAIYGLDPRARVLPAYYAVRPLHLTYRAAATLARRWSRR